MSKRKTSTTVDKTKVPATRLAMPKGRCWEVRYTCPVEKREIRISTGTRDLEQAQVKLNEVAAKLLLGIEAKPKQRAAAGPGMLWEDFRHDYTRLKVATFRSENSQTTAEVRLDLCASIINPRTLRDMAKPENLAKLQAELLVGSGGRRGQQEEIKPRSAHTVRSYMATVVAALNWAHKPMKWLPEPVEFNLAVTDDPDKGRPLCLEEFERMLAAVPKAITAEGVEADAAAVESWRYLLRGLWESGLRLSEALNLSWDITGTIVPHWPKRGLPYLHIPAGAQKSRRVQDVPTTPAMSALLLETPEASRTGWVFNPVARRKYAKRLTRPQVGRIITSIGAAANIVVSNSGKHASAHDLRRSFGQRMADAGLPPRDLQAIMRHRAFITTEQYYLRDRIQDQAERIAKYLGTTTPAPSGQIVVSQ